MSSKKVNKTILELVKQEIDENIGDFCPDGYIVLLDKICMDGLHKLLERAKDEKDTDSEAVLEWTLFKLQQHKRGI